MKAATLVEEAARDGARHKALCMDQQSSVRQQRNGPGLWEVGDHASHSHDLFGGYAMLVHGQPQTEPCCRSIGDGRVMCLTETTIPRAPSSSRPARHHTVGKFEYTDKVGSMVQARGAGLASPVKKLVTVQTIVDEQ
ncbi:hypothetical protein EJB05_50812, partial [Eragrostis curvula]